MKSLYIKSGKVEDIFNDLKDALEGSLSSNNSEHTLAINSALADGKIESVTFPEGIIYVQLDLTFKTDIMLSIEQLKNASLLFTYCSKGYFKHSIGTFGTKSVLKKDNSAILKSRSTINNILYFEKNVPIQFTFIGIALSEKFAFENDMLIKKLNHSFLNMEENIMHVEFQNLIIAKKIKDLNAIKQSGFQRNSLKKEIVQSILKIEMEQQTDGFTNFSNNVAEIAIKQMDEIKNVSNFIMNFRAEDFTMKFLTQKMGIQLNKFHKIFNF